MAAIRPVSFAQHYGINPTKLLSANIFDPLLNADTALFIDPILLPLSKAKEVSDQASDLFQNHFSDVFRLLTASKAEGDVAWKAARNLLDYKEVPFTCLGYGSSSIHGSSMSAELKAQVLKLANQIAEVGLIDPYLLPLLSMLERGIGPDHISDMVTGIIHPALADFTHKACKKFSVPMEKFDLYGQEYELPLNPLQTDKRSPVLLAPMDVLKHLPVAKSWDDVCDIAASNEELRQKVNQRIGEIFKSTALTEEEKRKARAAIFGSKEALQLISEALKSKSQKPYDFVRDRYGFILLQQLTDSLPTQVPLITDKIALDTPRKALMAILEQFKLLVEKHGYWKEFWAGERIKNESAMQRMLYIVAFAYCNAHDLDISPEVDLNSGRIDFKISKGAAQKIIVEVKKSSNQHLVPGVKSQLREYCQAEKASYGVYLVIDHGDSQDRWLPKLVAEANSVRSDDKIDIDIFVVEAHKRAAPSKGGAKKFARASRKTSKPRRPKRQS